MMMIMTFGSILCSQCLEGEIEISKHPMLAILLQKQIDLDLESLRTIEQSSDSILKRSSSCYGYLTRLQDALATKHKC